MPVEAGIQEVGDNNNFKDLDSRFRGNDGVFPITTQSPRREGVISFGCGFAALRINAPIACLCLDNGDWEKRGNRSN